MTRHFVVSPMQNAIFGIKSSFQGLLAASLASSRLSRRLLAALLPQDARKKQKTAFRFDGMHISKALRPQLGPPTGPQEGLKRGLLGLKMGPKVAGHIDPSGRFASTKRTFLLFRALLYSESCQLTSSDSRWLPKSKNSVSPTRNAHFCPP